MGADGYIRLVREPADCLGGGYKLPSSPVLNKCL